MFPISVRSIFNAIFWSQHVGDVSVVLFLAGALLLLMLPLPQLRRETYFSENALLAGRVQTHYSYVYHQYVIENEAVVNLLRHASAEERAQFIVSELRKVGIDSHIQMYTAYFTSPSAASPPIPTSRRTKENGKKGYNAFGVIQAPRSDGTEGLVLCASWKTKVNGQLVFNSHGVLLALSMARFWRRYSYWAKDVVILIADEEPLGTEAWLQSYHGVYDSIYLSVQPLPMHAGSLQAAINLHFEASHFHALGIDYTSPSGYLPNLDLINTVAMIARREGLTVSLHGSEMVRTDENAYGASLKRLSVMMWNQAGLSGKGTAGGGGWKRYNIDAITITGLKVPNSYYAYSCQQMGNVIESTFRTLNNLLEKLHQSFFFYLLTGIEHFISISVYVPTVILLSAGMVVGSLTLWWDTDAGYPESTISKLIKSRPKPPASDSIFPIQQDSSTVNRPSPFTAYPRRFGLPVALLGFAYACGGILYLVPNILTNLGIESGAITPTHIFLTVGFTSIAPIFPKLLRPSIHGFTLSGCHSIPSPNPVTLHIEATILKCFLLSLSAIVLLSLSTINFSIAVGLTCLLSPICLIVRPTKSYFGKFLLQLVLVAGSPITIIFFWSLWGYVNTHSSGVLRLILETGLDNVGRIVEEMYALASTDMITAVYTSAHRLMLEAYVAWIVEGGLLYPLLWAFWVPVNLVCWIIVCGF